MTSIAGGLNTGIWLCAVVLGAAGSAIIVTVAASLLCAGVKCIVKHWLGATKGTPEALSAHEEANILWLAGDGPLPPSEAEMQADGTLDFTSGPLAHLKDMLEKVNRHDRRVTVRVPVGGEDKTITLSYRLNGRQETASNAAAGTPRSVNTADIF